jgi:type II secretory pathway pseudopilin PulG
MHQAEMAKPESYNRHFSDGFTMVELLLGATVLALVIGGFASMSLISSRTSRQSGISNEIEALIDQDMAAIADLNRRYTCCPGSCTDNAATIAASADCQDASGNKPVAGDENYYTPLQPSLSSTPTSAMSAYEQACINGTVVNNLITAIQGLALPTATSPGILRRSIPIKVTEPADSPSPSHRIRWSYTGEYQGRTITSRMASMIPHTAQWCP